MAGCVPQVIDLAELVEQDQSLRQEPEQLAEPVELAALLEMEIRIS